MGWLGVAVWYFGILAVCGLISDEILPRVIRARNERARKLPNGTRK